MTYTKQTWLDLPSTTTPLSAARLGHIEDGIEAAAAAADLAASTHGATAKTTPVDADEFPIADSAATYVLKRVTFANIKAAVKTYYDTVVSTLTNKSIDLGSNTVTMTKAQLNTAVTDADVATLTGSETLTNKTVDLTSNTVTMTKAQLNTAVSDADVATLTGSETLTNKALTSPKINAIQDSNGWTTITLGAAGTVANYTSIDNATAGNPIQIKAVGSDTNVSMWLRPQGSGSVVVYSPTGQTPTVAANGADVNHSLNLVTKGTGTVQANGNPVGVKVAVPASASATGVVGQWAADSSFVYVCTAANTWVRSAAATW